MTSVESFPHPADEPGEKAEVVAVDFGKSQTRESEDIDEVILAYILSEKNRTFVMEQAEKYGTTPQEIIDSAVNSYALWVGIIESGSRLNYIDQSHQLHPINDSEDTRPPAA
jgi:hypothetical protein